MHCRVLNIAMVFLIVGFSDHAKSYAALQWEKSLNATSYASVQLFDGRPPEAETDSATGLTDFGAEVFVFDSTRAGVYGSYIYAQSSSTVAESKGALLVHQALLVVYGSGREDQTGGTAIATLTSTVDFYLPTKTVELQSRLNEDRVPLPDAIVSWNTTIENLSSATTIMTIDSPTGGTFAPYNTSWISGNVGDLIRISTSAEATLMDVPAGLDIYSQGQHDLDLIFTAIPEPSTTQLFCIGAMGLATLHRWHRKR
jgi:hypothetical protein